MLSFGKFTVKKMTLLDALKNYPESHNLYLHAGSAFHSTISSAKNYNYSHQRYFSYGLSASYRGTNGHGKHPLKKVIVYMVFDKEIPIAWSWLHEVRDSIIEWTNSDGSRGSRAAPRIMSFMLYIKPNMRRSGIGKYLYDLNKEICKNKHLPMLTFPHDFRSHNFYDALGAKYRATW